MWKLSLIAVTLVTGSLQAERIGCNPYVVGRPSHEYIPLNSELLIEISDQLIRDEIAVVDIDPEAFDIDEKPKTRKKDGLDDIEFLSEKEVKKKR